MKILAGDIGGTKTNLALFEVAGTSLQTIRSMSWPSNQYTDLASIIKLFFAEIEDASLIEMACFGVAGPVIENCCKVTNLPWVVDAMAIQKLFDLRRVELLNDLEANAWGIPALKEEDFVVLNQGIEVAANASIISAGTGLGEAGMFWNGTRHIPFASEGGHSDFSPATKKEFALLEFMQQQYRHVSWERIVSGMGLVNLYRFLCHHYQQSTPTWLAEQFQQDDPAAVISRAAQERSDPLCIEALDWLVHLYGVEAGNHALKIMARGGVFIGGGIAPKLAKKLQEGSFINAFVAKGRMSALLREMPVKIIMNDKTALFGPALYAASFSV